MNLIALLMMLTVLGSWVAAGTIAVQAHSLIGLAFFIIAIIAAYSPLRRML